MKIERLSIKKNLITYNQDAKNKNITEILNSRFEEWECILHGDVSDLHDPYMLKDMDKAVERIKTAKQNNETVMIFGDYDVDGVTSTAILMHFFQKIWLRASYRIPDRVKDGYGMKTYFIDELQKIWVNLIVTVDCGTKDIEVVDYAKKLWIDVIITDHHAVPDEHHTNAVAVINPKRIDCDYIYKHLAWAWVAFKLIQALAPEFLEANEAEQYIKETIDIAAIWTVADCMKLTWENRIIVQAGLKQIKNSRSVGIRKLIEDKEENLDADIFWFHIWPRLNAAGRMDSAYKAVNLILNNSLSVNNTLREIETLNELRKEKTKAFVEDAMWKIRRNDNLIFYVSKDIAHGIIWIVAGRLTEQFYKPAIVLKDEWDKLVASCRSPDYFSIIEILSKYKDEFLTFWWHKQAAGFTISKEKFSAFKTKILQELNALDFSTHKKQIQVDKILRLEEIGFRLLDEINTYKPFGLWNEKPLFMVENLLPEKIEFLWKGRDHLRFTTKHWFKIFAFFMWEYYEEIKRNKKPLSIIFDMSEDFWMGNKNILLKVVDIILE